VIFEWKFWQKSINIINALQMARDLKISTIGLLGSGGGQAVQLCDLAVIIPSNTTGRIQESHITVGHTIMELIEDILINKGYLICN
jgi:D-sedoheptulose 7-phosphate isomerase